MAIKRIVLGTMTFGWSKSSSQLDDAQSTVLLNAFAAKGYRELDTALIYMDAPGVAEKMLGRIAHNDGTFEIHTKAHPMLGQGGKLQSGSGGLSAEHLRAQVADSLSNLKLSSLPLLYLHQPDTQTDLIDTLRACNELHKEGLIQRLGMSNYHVSEVRLAVELCKQHNWLCPTVYQGNYNALNRDVEDELLPTLKELNISFLAYNPLAAGLLTGKYVDKAAVPTSGRFGENKNYQDRYWKDDTFLSMQKLHKVCEENGLTVIQTAFSWLLHHSQLSNDHQDGIVLGVSSLGQLNQNLEICANAKPLPTAVLSVLEECWELCKPDAFRYSRGKSGAGGDATVGITK